MGTDKALLCLGGATLLRRAVDVLARVTPRVVLASGTRTRPGGLECVLDEIESAGPLAGLAAVLARVERERVAYACVLACDMPRVDATLFRRLLRLVRETNTEAALAATPDGDEPLCAVYHVRALPTVRRALARGDRRMNAFHEDIAVARLALPRASLHNLNTREDFLAAGGSP
jgi:molybdopterin-guanine dinucleotide biosynthesis protein A